MGRGGVGDGGGGSGGGGGKGRSAPTTQLPVLEEVAVYPAVAKNTSITITPMMKSLRVMAFFSVWTVYSSFDSLG